VQIVPVQGVAIQPAPVTAAVAVAPVGPAAPVAPMEPGRRVTASRENGRSDLQGQQQAQKSSQKPTRGRLLDLTV
jgi:hypothetical protein